MSANQRAGLCGSSSVSPIKGSTTLARWILTPSLEPAASVAGLSIAAAGRVGIEEARAAGRP
eukprot:2710813-Alexandrium_andersonii.AAC.1